MASHLKHVLFPNRIHLLAKWMNILLLLFPVLPFIAQFYLCPKRNIVILKG